MPRPVRAKRRRGENLLKALIGVRLLRLNTRIEDGVNVCFNDIPVEDEHLLFAHHNQRRRDARDNRLADRPAHIGQRRDQLSGQTGFGKICLNQREEFIQKAQRLRGGHIPGLLRDFCQDGPLTRGPGAVGSNRPGTHIGQRHRAVEMVSSGPF